MSLDREREQFIVQMRGDIQMDKESVLDLSRCSQIILNSSGQTKAHFGNIEFRKVIGIRANHLEISGSIALPPLADPLLKEQSVVLVKIDKSVVFHGTSKIEAGHIMIQNNGTIETQPGFNLTSTINSTCNTDRKQNKLFTCVPHKTLNLDFNHSTYIDSFN